jgi:hypothetical protein
VPEAHPELLHYTSVAGLLGILQSDSLRATHSAFLNDSTEISLFFEKRLARILEAGIRAELAADPDLPVRHQFASTPEEADAVVSRYACDMADAIRTTTQRFNEPYIACFSAPANDRVRTDGLLSQWRGYGKDGGYALVFDTKRLEELLRTEASSVWYQHAQWGDVHYHQDDNDLETAEPEIHQAEDALRAAIGSFIRNPESSEELEATFEPVATLSCLYKHWGFHEEREVRIVAIPPNEELIQQGRGAGEVRPVRARKMFIRGGTPVPYLDLFAQNPRTEAFRLPIRRVIVGPHPQSQLRRQAVEQVLRTAGVDAEIVVSQIPYIGG